MLGLLSVHLVRRDTTPLGQQGHFCVQAHLPPQPCSLGTYNENLGQTECTPCDPGTYTPAQGSVECSTCPAGSSCGNADVLPEECSPGINLFFANQNNSIISVQVILVPRVK